MPGKVKVKIISGRNLPVMDRSSDTTDAYVEVKLGSTTYKTDVCRKTLHPQWNSEWYRFEVDDSELQDEPLQIRIMDHDTYSANDAIGKVYMDLNPLLLPASGIREGSHEPSSNALMSGWIPVYDTMHGIRGEVNIAVKVELFSDFNRFRQSSCGVQFFYSKSVPHGYFTQIVHGLVEELIVNDDPEYQWIDKIRTPRASNEARQTLFFKLSGELRRKIGVKAIDLGGNAVIGYCQCFDLEGESGIVARGIGTAVTLTKLIDATHAITAETDDDRVQYLFPSTSTSTFYLYKSPFHVLKDHSIDRVLPPIYTRSNPSLMSHMYHNPSLRTLLQEEEMRGTPGHGLGQRIKNLKYSSQTILSKKMTALKARLGDRELDANIVPVSSAERKRKMFSKRTLSENPSAMAEILARSVIHAHSSLTCILENQGSSELDSDTLDELKPIADLLENEETQSLLEQTNRSSSTSDSSVSDDDDEDERNQQAESVDFDTVSMIIKQCAILEEHAQARISRQLSLPIIPYNSSSAGELVQDDSDSEDGEENVPVAETELEAPKATLQTIMPHRNVQVDLKHEGLVKTAMQTILLDKANIMGSFTPPSSPIAREKPTFLPKKMSTLSLDNIGSSPVNRQKSAMPVCLSDSELNKKATDSARSAQPSRKKLPSFLRLPKSKPRSKLKKVKSDELHKKSRLSFMKRHKPIDTSHKPKSQSLIHNIFHKEEREEDKLKKHGLVDAALGNVLMETVQDILATSTLQDKPKKSPTAFPSSVILTPSNDELNQANSREFPANESELCCNPNIVHASLMPPNRNIVSPPTAETNQEAAVNHKNVQSPAKVDTTSCIPPCIYRRSSDSDLSITPKGNSLTGSGIALNGHPFKSNALLRSTVPQENFDMMEYPFLTMTRYPHGCILQIGGAVFARSVKLLERISNLEEPESRDTWWSEIRMEIRSHARALNCNAILGYSESTSICEDVCVLSASGTAAVVSGFHYSSDETGTGIIAMGSKLRKDLMISPLERNEPDKERVKMKPLSENKEQESAVPANASCAICHLPYNTNNMPVRATVLKCACCRIGKVPDVIITTLEVPEGLPLVGRACFVQSFVCRQLKDLRGESNAKEISDGLPFLEYELHRLLVNKMRIKGMNAVFGLQIRISIGEKMLVGSATGTAVFIAALPKPALPKLVSDRNSDEKKLYDLQKHLNDTVKRNREIYLLGQSDDTIRALADDAEDEHPITAIDLGVGNKDCCLLEVDDPEDAQVLSIIMEERPPDGFLVVNTEFLPGLEQMDIVRNLQMFTQVYRAKFQPPYNFDLHFRRLLQSVYFKLRRMVPCALCNLQCRIDLPETDEIQLCLYGIAVGLEDPQKIKARNKNIIAKIEDEDMIFNLEEDQQNDILQSQVLSKLRQKSPVKMLQHVKQRHYGRKGERHGVDMTPLSYIPGAKIEQYLGNLNFFFIRETTSIREEGGLSGFIHSFVTEVLAIVRAHVTALGGNAMIAYFMRECVLNHNLHKNQGQCLINVGGDVVFVVSNSEE